MREIIKQINAPLPACILSEKKLKALLGTPDEPLKKVFVCSPYAGCVKQNVQNARMFSRFVFLCGRMPITPHLLFPRFLEDRKPVERDAGIRMGLMLLDVCDELWAFGPAVSSGMKREIAYAMAHGIPVRYFSNECKEVKKRVRKRNIPAGTR
jgi:hypothetical protein